MKSETLEKIMGKLPEVASPKKQEKEHGSAPHTHDPTVDEKWMNVQKPDMSTGDEWMDSAVTTQPVSGNFSQVDMRSDRKKISHQI